WGEHRQRRHAQGHAWTRRGLTGAWRGVPHPRQGDRDRHRGGQGQGRQARERRGYRRRRRGGIECRSSASRARPYRGGRGGAVATKIKRYEWGDSFFVIYAALDRPIHYRAGAAADAAAYVHAAGDSFEELATMFAECRAGLLPVAPMVGIINEGAMDPSRAPE